MSEGQHCTGCDDPSYAASHGCNGVGESAELAETRERVFRLGQQRADALALAASLRTSLTAAVERAERARVVALTDAANLTRSLADACRACACALLDNGAEAGDYAVLTMQASKRAYDNAANKLEAMARKDGV